MMKEMRDTIVRWIAVIRLGRRRNVAFGVSWAKKGMGRLLMAFYDDLSLAELYVRYLGASLVLIDEN